MYHFPSKKIVTATLIAEALLKSFYSRLGFKVIKDLATSPNSEEACNKFKYESGKSKALQKQLASNFIKPSHNVLQIFMIIKLTLIKIEICSNIYMRFHHQMIRSHMNIFILSSRSN